MLGQRLGFNVHIIMLSALLILTQQQIYIYMCIIFQLTSFFLSKVSMSVYLRLINLGVLFVLSIVSASSNGEFARILNKESWSVWALAFAWVFFNNCTLVRMDYTTSLLEYTVNTSDYTTQPLEQSSHTGHRCALVTELTSKLCGSSVLPNALLCCLLTITGSRWERKSSSHIECSLHPQHLVLYISTKITWPI